MNFDKKVKLDELPDEGSEVQPQMTPEFKEKSSDPRLKRLKNLDDSLKIKEMTQRWYFDRPVLAFGWMIYLTIVIMVQLARPHEQYVKEIALLNLNSMDIGDAFNFTSSLEWFLLHPLIFAFITPLVFSFTKPSIYFFEITFDGLSAVKEVNREAEIISNRVFVKWDEIVHVQKSLRGHRDVLQLFSSEGKMAELIWDINKDQKKAVKLILNGLIDEDHPLRQYLEKEVK